MTINITHASTDQDIASTFEVMRQLRPHLEQDKYVEMIRSLMASDGLELLVLSENATVRAVAAYRMGSGVISVI